MSEPVAIRTLADVIQASVSPVFLLAGIGALLNVMVLRLSRVVDRYRFLITQVNETSAQMFKIKTEVDILASRIQLINWAIGSFSFGGLLVCFVVSSLFSRTVFNIYINTSVIAMLFISSMGMIAVGLIFFLRETTLSATSLIDNRE